MNAWHTLTELATYLETHNLPYRMEYGVDESILLYIKINKEQIWLIAIAPDGNSEIRQFEQSAKIQQQEAYQSLASYLPKEAQSEMITTPQMLSEMVFRAKEHIWCHAFCDADSDLVMLVYARDKVDSIWQFTFDSELPKVALFEQIARRETAFPFAELCSKLTHEPLDYSVCIERDSPSAPSRYVQSQIDSLLDEVTQSHELAILWDDPEDDCSYSFGKILKRDASWYLWASYDERGCDDGYAVDQMRDVTAVERGSFAVKEKSFLVGLRNERLLMTAWQGKLTPFTALEYAQEHRRLVELKLIDGRSIYEIGYIAELSTDTVTLSRTTLLSPFTMDGFVIVRLSDIYRILFDTQTLRDREVLLGR